MVYSLNHGFNFINPGIPNYCVLACHTHTHNSHVAKEKKYVFVDLSADNEENEEENDDVDGKDTNADAGINRSISVDNENPQTPDENADAISELFPTGNIPSSKRNVKTCYF